MAAHLIPQRQRFGRRRTRRMSDINVTPFIDVMLVLLIVFMVTAPLLIAGTPIEMPGSAQAPALATDDKTILVRVGPGGEIRLGRPERAVKLDDLVGEVTKLAGRDMGRSVVILGDRGARYGQVAAVIGPLSAAGFGALALGRMDEPDTKKPPVRPAGRRS